MNSIFKTIRTIANELTGGDRERTIYLLRQGDIKFITEAEAKEQAQDYILESICYFNPEFLAAHTNGLDAKVIKLIQRGYEESNAALISLIEDIDHFIEDAISADGLGHFLNSYDEELCYLEGDLIAFRTN